MDGQVTWSDLGFSCGKTWSEPLAATKEKTSQQFSKKSLKSSNRKPPVLKCLKTAGQIGGGYHDKVGGRWSVVWRTHDAQYWGKTIRDSRTGDVLQMGTPQRRRRISVVADFGGDAASEILFELESLPGHPAESGAAGEGFAEAAEKARLCAQQNQPKRIPLF